MEELKFALGKVGIKALIAPPSFKKSNYYICLCQIIPELSSKEEGRGEISFPEFPYFKHFIIIDSAEQRNFR